MAPQLINNNLLRQDFEYLKKFNALGEREIEANPELRDCLPVDHRDLGMFVMVMHWDDPKWMNNDPSNPLTEEEFLSELHRIRADLKVHPMTYVNKFYDIVESYSISGQKNVTSRDNIHAMLFTRLNQEIGKIPQDTPGILKQRYESSVEGMRKYDYIDRKALNEGVPMVFELNGYGLDINNFKTGVHQDDPDYEEQDFGPFWRENRDEASYENKKAYDKVLSGEKKDFEYEVPAFVSKIAEMDAHFKDNEAPCDPDYASEAEKGDYGDYIKTFMETVHPHNSHDQHFLQMAYDGKEIGKSIYIDGKPLSEGLVRDNDHPKDYLRAVSLRLANAINEGKPIDVLSSYDLNGRIYHTVTPVKCHPSKAYQQNLEDSYCEENNIGWIHRHVFNWGPWKIQYPDPLKEANVRNELTQAQRNVRIEADAAKNLEPLYNKMKIVEAKKELENAREDEARKEKAKTKEFFQGFDEVDEANKEANQFLENKKFQEGFNELVGPAEAFMENPSRRPLNPAEEQEIHDMVEDPEGYMKDELNQSFVDEDTIGIKDPDNEVIEK